MEVKWAFVDEQILFEMSAPTNGWIAIGFNESNELAGTYLLMGAVRKGRPVVEEHYTLAPGDYPSFKELGEPAGILSKDGNEIEGVTMIRFSLSQKSFYQYSKKLTPGSKYNMLMAYSQEDDFEHHSIMRTSILIQL